MIRWNQPLAALALAALALAGCSGSQEVPTAPQDALDVPSPTTPTFSYEYQPTRFGYGTQVYPLIADGGDATTATEIGEFKVWNDATNLWVRFNLFEDWCFTETHVHIGTRAEDVPQKRGNPQPGQFDYPYYADGCEASHTYPPIPLSGWTAGTELVIAAHAKVFGEQVDLAVVSRPGVDVYGPLAGYYGFEAPEWGTSVPAVAAWKHPNWPLIGGSAAVWISNTEYIEGDVAGSSWRLFEDAFEMPDDFYLLTASVLTATADNAEEVYLNGEMIGSDGEVQGTPVDDSEWGTLLDYPFTPVPGTNALSFIVRNYPGSADPTANPTGLLYAAGVSYLSRSESAWASDPAGTDVDGNGFGFDFEGRNWAMYLRYTVGYTCDGFGPFLPASVPTRTGAPGDWPFDYLILGTDGDDVIGREGRSDDGALLATDGPDLIVLFGGDDVAQGARGADVMCGGPGNDELIGNRDADYIFGEGDDDTLDGRNYDDAADECYGGEGTDTYLNCEVTDEGD